jgi:integrase
MVRHQKGYIFETGGAFHIRYYTDVIVDGKPERKQKSERLGAKDRNTGWATKKSSAVKTAAAEFMAKVNARSTSTGAAQDMSIVDFYHQRYLPYNEDPLPLTGKPRKKSSTMRGYRQIWTRHLEKHFGTRTLRQYESTFGTQLLQSLTGTQRKITLKHIRAVGSAIFRLAVVEQRIMANPWHEVVMPDDALASEETEHYILREAEDMISALVDHVDAQLVLALACFPGLGPAEIGGLQWGDVDEDVIQIRRNKYRGQITTPKTKERAASVPILDQVRVPLELWRRKCGEIAPDQFIIPDLPNLLNLVIKPHVSGKNNLAKRKECDRCGKIPDGSGVEWKGLYAGRRGMVTMVIESTGGNYAVAQAMARHKKMTTTLNVYKKQITPEAKDAGVNLYQKMLNK